MIRSTGLSDKQIIESLEMDRDEMIQVLTDHQDSKDFRDQEAYDSARENQTSQARTATISIVK